MKSHLSHGEYSGWKEKEVRPFVQDLTKSGDKECFDGASSRKRRRDGLSLYDKTRYGKSLVKRQIGEDPFDPLEGIPLPGDNLGDKGWNSLQPTLRCVACGSCAVEGSVSSPCCGCSCLPCRYGWSIYEPSELLFPLQSRVDRRYIHNSTKDSPIGDAPQGAREELQPRGPETPGSGRKPIRVCSTTIQSQLYPTFPDYSRNEDSRVDFDSNENSRLVPKFFHNSSSLCTSWAIGKFPQIDQVWDKDKGRYRKQFYDSKSGGSPLCVN